MPFRLPANFAEHCLLAYCPWGEAGPVHRAERALCEPWGSNKRQQEFLSGRSAAHRALGALGFPFLPIGKGPRGEPLWPPGAIASLAHDAKGAACLAARRPTKLLALGLDFEPTDRQISPAALETVFSLEERALLPDRQKQVAAFCAKEALFKCLFPLTKVWFGFSEARLVEISEKNFAFELVGELWPGKKLNQPVRGQFAFSPGRQVALLGLDKELNWLA